MFSGVKISNDDWKRPDIPIRCTWHLGVKQKSPHTQHRSERENLRVYPDILHAIGHTPLVELKNLAKKHDIKCRLFAKCEFLNPFGSVKDRIGYRMVLEAEKSGILKQGSTLIEPTSGNTGIGIAAAAAVKGYRCIIVIPEKMSDEKINVLKALGAEIYRTPTASSFDDPSSNIRVAQRLRDEIKDAVILDQYTNPYNPVSHYDGTAEEIIEQCDHKLDCVIVAAGTGGAITGVSRKIKEKLPNCQVVGVDPHGSILALPDSLNKQNAGFYEVEGIGYDFIPTVLDRSQIDRWVKTDDKMAFRAARDLIKYEGLLAGGSSGSVLYAALEVCKDMKEGTTCVILLPDSIRNYMTKFLKPEWMYEKGFDTPTHCFGSEIMNKPVEFLDLNKHDKVTEDCSISQAFSLLEKNGFSYPLPIIDNKGNFMGAISPDSICRIVELPDFKMSSPVTKIIDRSCKKVIIGEAKVENIFYALKSADTVFVLKINTGDQGYTYEGQISKDHFYRQLNKLIVKNYRDSHDVSSGIDKLQF